MSNSQHVLGKFYGCFCLRDHEHATFQGVMCGRSASQHAAHHPLQMVQALADPVAAHVSKRARMSR